MINFGIHSTAFMNYYCSLQHSHKKKRVLACLTTMFTKWLTALIWHFKTTEFYHDKDVSRRNTICQNFLLQKLNCCIYSANCFWQIIAVTFEEKATDIVALIFLPGTYRSYKAKFCLYISWNAENCLETYRTILLFYFQES